MINNITSEDFKNFNRVCYEGFSFLAMLVFGTALNYWFLLIFQIKLQSNCITHDRDDALSSFFVINKQVHLQLKEKGKYGQSHSQFSLTHSSLECLHLLILHSAEADK